MTRLCFILVRAEMQKGGFLIVFNMIKSAKFPDAMRVPACIVAMARLH